MNPVNINELPFSSKAHLCWSFFWRSIATSIGGSICGALIGGLLGFVLGMLGAPKGVITALSALVGIGVGLGFVYLYVRWILSSRMGSFRLALLEE